MAVVEAKRQGTDVYAAIDQAKCYSRSYKIKGNEILPGGPWGEYRVPFVFATRARIKTGFFKSQRNGGRSRPSRMKI